jgi:hypothetical protein
MFEPQLRVTTWHIVEEQAKEEDAPPRFAVLRENRRVAWGLRDRAAAARWIHRLGGTWSTPSPWNGEGARG